MSEKQTFSLITPAPLGSSKWLLHLRTFAVAGQLATIVTAYLLTLIDLPYGWLLSLVLLTAVTNVVYALWLGSHRKGSDHRIQPQFGVPRPDDPMSESFHRVALGLMVLDLVTLSAMLHLSGGVGNPSCFFYFVNLAVGGVMIRPRAAWILTATAIIGYCVLLTLSPPISGLMALAPSAGSMQSVGLLFAFSACATVVTYFVTRTAGELKEREQQLLAAQAAQANSQRLEGLTTLAAGAAHELATPLSTIDVIVRELSRHLEACEKPESVNHDLKLIDGQLEMCRQILQRMRTAAGDSMAQRWDHTTVGELIDTTLEGIRDPHRVDVIDGSDETEATSLWVPQEAVAQAVRNLIHNALDASGDDGRVRLSSRVTSADLELTIIDSGHGMSHEVLSRASDPFFTTKEPGRGIGLGLFLTRNVISQLGGNLQFRSAIAMGTQAVVTVPLRPPNLDETPSSSDAR